MGVMHFQTVRVAVLSLARGNDGGELTKTVKRVMATSTDERYRSSNGEC